MIAIYCVHPRDEELALQNAFWMNELGGCKGHEVLFIHDQRVKPDLVQGIMRELSHCFKEVHSMMAGAMIDGWPEGANYFFRIAMGWLEARPYPYFLWLEPDAIPMKEGWMDELEAEYRRGRKPFMGDRVEVENVPLHMSGIGVYQNPIYQKAGEAYRAFDLAWDMAAKDQIVPHAYFTKLIEHAWKHPKFTSIDELRTQIRPETILFHSSKDGSLIHLLRQKRGGNKPVVAIPVKEPPERGSPSPLPVDTQKHDIICDIFIRTYPGDYSWLGYCLKAIQKYARGFRKVWIISPGDNPFISSSIFKDQSKLEWKKVNEETEDGYLAQQIHKLYADVLAPGADYYLHIDSDVILHREIRPEAFFMNGSVAWPFTPYSAIETPWQEVIEKFMGQSVTNEFMRRFPIMIPVWLYGKLREFCYHQHKRIISEYIRNQPLRAFSEFNALGAFAYLAHHEKFFWVDTRSGKMPAPVAKQYHSWGGITPEIKEEIEGFLGKAVPEPEFSVAAEPTTGIPSLEEIGTRAAQPIIKKLPNDIWVIHGDQISGWVEECGRLDHDPNLLPEILKQINPGDCVVDAGAFIGDHTIAYVRKVGPKGLVFAFEPNPVAIECLRHNVQAHNVAIFDRALGEHDGIAPLSGNNGVPSGGYLGEHMKVADIAVAPLDDFHIAPDFIKLDVEGCELKALQGAEKTINKHHPRMVIEINREALERQLTRPEHIFAWLQHHGYKWQIIQENCTIENPLYDIVALPEEPKIEAVHPSIADHIKALSEYSQGGKERRKYVLRLLREHGLSKRITRKASAKVATETA